MRFFTLDSARTMYGMVNNSNFSVTGKYTVKNHTCRFCEQPAALHVLQSTVDDNESTFQLTTRLRARLYQLLNERNWRSKFNSNKEKMIGVLKVRNNVDIVFASHSGQFGNDELFSQACVDIGLNYSPPVELGRVRNRALGLVPRQYQNFDYQCAAPRMIQHALSMGLFPSAMTEMCFKGPTDGRVAGSCGRCRKTIPPMLCPTELLPESERRTDDPLRTR